MFNIPMNSPDNKLYDILGVPRTISDEDLRKKYKKLALKYHPDRNKEAGALEKFKEISTAYDILGDKEKRSKYDKYGLEGFKSMEASGMGDMGGMGGMGMGGDPFDLFSNIFGQSTSRKKRTVKGRDRVEYLEIDLIDFYMCNSVSFNYEKTVLCCDCKGTGGKYESSVVKCEICNGTGMIMRVVQMGIGMISQTQSPCQACNQKGTKIKKGEECPKCNGKKTMKVTKKINVNLRPNTFDGEKITVKGEADQSPDMDIYGNLVLVLKQKPHTKYRRYKNDLLLDYNISLIDSLCGCVIKIGTLDNRTIVIKTNEIIHPNSVYRITNEGMKNTPDSRGNLFVKFTVIFPDKISNERQVYLKKLLKPVNIEGKNSDETDSSSPADSLTQLEENESIKIMEKCTRFDESKFNQSRYKYSPESNSEPENPEDIQCATQ